MKNDIENIVVFVIWSILLSVIAVSYGYDMGQKKERKIAIKENVGEYFVIERMTGKTEFRYITQNTQNISQAKSRTE